MRFCFIVIAISIYLPAWCVGQWQLNGVAVFDTSLQGNNTTIPHVAPDGEGGAYICWADYRHGNYDIYAQRIDSVGNTLWQRNGVPIVVAPQRQADMQIVNDGFGNAIIAWEDDRGTDTYIYTQKVNPNGQALWQANGVKVAELSGLFTRITADGLGGVILAWDAVVSNSDVVTQRLNSLGTRMWGDSGVRVTDRPSTIYPGDVWIVNDGASGAVVAWTERQINRIYAQRVDSSGTVRWQANGVLLSDTVSTNFDVAACSDDSGGAIVSWVNSTQGLRYAQRLNSTGARLWGSGVQLGAVAAGGGQRHIADAFGGAFIGHGLFIQHVDSNGTKLWQSNGVPYTTLPSIESTQARTGEGGVWNFCKSLDSVGFNLYRQWIDHTGTQRWGQNGIRLLTINSTQRLPQGTEDGRGNCFVTWEDYRRGYWAVFIAKVDTGGTVTSVQENQGSAFPPSPRLHQNYPNPFNSDTIIHYELPKREHVILKVFDLLGRQVAVIADGIESAGEHTVAFKANNLSSGVYLYRLITSNSAQTNKMLLLR